MHRIAVIGSGIAGLSAAWRLADAHAGHQVTLFEAGSHFGGHANTVDLALEGVAHGVDTGFLVYNQRTYPLLTALFAELGVASAPSEMSLSVQCLDAQGRSGLEWSGTSLNAVFAQRRNLLRPRFWGMLGEILRFNRLTTELARAQVEDALQSPIADFLHSHGFGKAFREDYLLPMIGSIWSCPTEQMLQFPIATLVRFCHNHGLLQVTNRPQWYTVRGGSREYVRRMVARLQCQGVHQARLHSPVLSVRRLDQGVLVQTAQGSEAFDAVVMACHSDQALALLGADATPLESAVWNYERAAGADAHQARVCLHYLLNRLQPLPWQQPVIVSLNPSRAIDESRIHQRIEYSHPVFDLAAIQAQGTIAALQGERRTWFCGAWTGYGFHEDGLRSGLEAAQGVMQALRRLPRPVARELA